MKPFVFSKNSWHYWLASEFGSLRVWEYDDICTYTRAVLRGMFWGSVVFAILLGLAYWLLITIVWWVVVLQYGFLEVPSAITMTVMIFIATVSVAVNYSVKWLKRTIHNNKSGRIETKDPGFITKAYRSWKDKTCVSISFTEE